MQLDTGQSSIKNQHSLKSLKSPSKQSHQQQKKGLNQDKGFSQKSAGNYQEFTKQIKEQEQEIIKLRCQIQQIENTEAVMKDLQQEISSLKQQLAESEQVRQQLQDQIVNNTNIKEDLQVKRDKIKEELSKENDQVKKQLLTKDQSIKEKDARIEYLRNLLDESELEKHQMKLQIEQYKQNYKSNDNYLFESEEQRIKIQKQYEQCIDEYNQKLKEQYEIIDRLNKELEQFKTQKREFELIQQQLKQELQKKDKLLKQEQDQTKKFNELTKILNDVKNERDMLLKQLKEYENQQKQNENQISKIRQEFEDQLNKLRSNYDKLNELKNQQQKELIEKEQELLEKDQKIKELKDKQLELGQAMANFQKFLDAHNDLKKQLENSKKQIEKLQSDKEAIQQELLESNKLLEVASMGNQEYQEKIKQLLNRIREQDEEIDAMKRYVQQMRAKFQIYIPDKDDPIDSQLAEYINNYPERSKLRILFMKESEGIYQFGSRRVYVRIERDKITVRVGGGFLSIDEFLDIYTPQELEKVERNDPIKKFSEKIAVSKTLQYQSPLKSPKNNDKVNFESYERKNRQITSPIRESKKE